MNNLEQRKRVQEINAKIAMLCDYNRDLRGDITANTLEISGLLDERDKIGSVKNYILVKISVCS